MGKGTTDLDNRGPVGKFIDKLLLFLVLIGVVAVCVIMTK